MDVTLLLVIWNKPEELKFPRDLLICVFYFIVLILYTNFLSSWTIVNVDFFGAFEEMTYKYIVDYNTCMGI